VAGRNIELQHLSSTCPNPAAFTKEKIEKFIFFGSKPALKCWTVVLAAVRAARLSEMRHLCLIHLLSLALLIDQDSGQLSLGVIVPTK
jgi:hypothetical protein